MYRDSSCYCCQISSLLKHFNRPIIVCTNSWQYNGYRTCTTDRVSFRVHCGCFSNFSVRSQQFVTFRLRKASGLLARMTVNNDPCCDGAMWLRQGQGGSVHDDLLWQYKALWIWHDSRLAFCCLCGWFHAGCESVIRNWLKIFPILFRGDEPDFGVVSIPKFMDSDTIDETDAQRITQNPRLPATRIPKLSQPN